MDLEKDLSIFYPFFYSKLFVQNDNVYVMIDKITQYILYVSILSYFGLNKYLVQIIMHSAASIFWFWLFIPHWRGKVSKQR